MREYERDFDRVDFAWRNHRFHIYEQFRFPEEKLQLNLDAMRTFARGVGHFMTTARRDQILRPEPVKAENPRASGLALPPKPKKKIVWFRWGTRETYRFDARDFVWVKYDPELKPFQPPPFDHLYFSSVAHLTDGRGAYVTGGSDELGNYYRRVLYFKDYESYEIVADMIRNRGNHCSAYIKKRNVLFVFGGNAGGDTQTIPSVEMLDIKAKAWVARPRMNEPREGASACVFEASLMIFVFGGTNL